MTQQSLTVQTNAISAPVKADEPPAEPPAALQPQPLVPVPPHHEDQTARAISPFSDKGQFEAAQRMAKALATSTLVPDTYRGNIQNTMIAMELAHRIGASVLMVMQCLNVIHGRPSWDSKFLIATVNASGKFSAIRYRFEGKPGTDEWGCRAVARDKATGEECVGVLVTMKMAKDEGWFAKNGSKWKTMPELMLCYRSAAFWTRLFAPELSLGLLTSDEVIETTGFTVPESIAPGDAASLEAELLGADKDGVLP